MLPLRAELSQLVEEERTSLELEEELTRQIVDELEAEITDEQAALQQLVDEVLWEGGAHDGAGAKYGKLQMQYQMLMSRFGRETQNLVRFQSEPPFAPSYAPGTAPTWGGAAQGDTAGSARGVPADTGYATWYAENASYWDGFPEGGEYTGAEAGGSYGEDAHEDAHEDAQRAHGPDEEVGGVQRVQRSGRAVEGSGKATGRPSVRGSTSVKGKPLKRDGGKARGGSKPNGSVAVGKSAVGKSGPRAFSQHPRASSPVPDRVLGTFEYFDSTRSGYLEYKYLRSALLHYGLEAKVEVTDPDGQLDLHEFAELVRDLEERISREELTPPDHRNAAGAHSDGGPNALIPRRPPHGHQRVGGGATR